MARAVAAAGASGQARAARVVDGVTSSAEGKNLVLKPCARRLDRRRLLRGIHFVAARSNELQICGSHGMRVGRRNGTRAVER